MKDMKAVLTKAKRSKVVKKAEKGHDFGKKNVKGKTGFANVVAHAEKEGMSEKSAKKVAGAQFWKMMDKK